MIRYTLILGAAIGNRRFPKLNPVKVTQPINITSFVRKEFIAGTGI
jgi:hypothetical protein